MKSFRQCLVWFADAASDHVRQAPAVFHTSMKRAPCKRVTCCKFAHAVWRRYGFVAVQSPLTLLLVVLIFTSGCVRPLQRMEYTAVVMASEARIVIYAKDEEAGREAARAAIKRMRALDRVMSDYMQDSELSMLAVGPVNSPQPVSSELYRVLEIAHAISHATDGAFDVTVGPLTRLWREARNTGTLPDTDAITSARRAIGWQNLQLDPSQRTVTLVQEGMALDLGGIGKGYAVDEAMKVLHSRGITRSLVGLAGDIAVANAPPGRDGWQVAIDVSDEARPLRLTLANTAISTSGDRYQYIEIDGIRHSHIINPRSESSIGQMDRRAITIIARDAATADALATALSVLEPSEHDRVLRMFDARVIVHR